VNGRPPRALRGFEGIKRYWDKTRDRFAAKILPGEYYVSRSDELITTVLGSCVSACLWDPFSRVGGMNHFMLPHDASGNGGRWGALEELRASTRYGTFAMESLINGILANGGERRNLKAKVFGGGRVLRQMSDVGMRNIHFVRHYLESEGISVFGEDLGGPYPRKVVFYPLTGKAFVKRLRVLHNETIVEREQEYLHDIDAKPVQGSVELF